MVMVRGKGLKRNEQVRCQHSAESHKTLVKTVFEPFPTYLSHLLEDFIDIPSVTRLYIGKLDAYFGS